jgi:hypothetical protein
MTPLGGWSVPSRELHRHVTGLCPWSHLSVGPSSRKASPSSDGRERDSSGSGTTRTKGGAIFLIHREKIDELV